MCLLVERRGPRLMERVYSTLSTSFTPDLIVGFGPSDKGLRQNQCLLSQSSQSDGGSSC